MGHVSFLLDKMRLDEVGLDEMGLDEMGINPLFYTKTQSFLLGHTIVYGEMVFVIHILWCQYP